MKKLTKEHIAVRDGLVEKLDKAKKELELKIESYNSEMSDNWRDVKIALEEYNDLVGEANEWREDIHGEMEQFASDKSEKWSEGEAGEAFSEWMNSFDESFEEAYVDEPEELDVPEMEVIAALEQLPEEA